MAVTGYIARNINKVQTDNFYFTIYFILPDGASLTSDGFSLSNIVISQNSHVSTDDMALLYIEPKTVVISVDLPSNISDNFTISLTGTVSIDTNGVITQETIDGNSKNIKYNTSVSSEVTFDTTPTAEEPTIVTMQLSAASANNGGIIVVQIDFDYPVPYFNSSYVTVTPAGATKSAASNIDDDFKVWILLVTLPTTGSGMVQVSINEDAIGFTHDDVRAEVQHQENTHLTIHNDRGTLLASTDPAAITSTDDTTQQPIKGMDFERVLTIRGNNVHYVDVYGMLRPFYHHWDSTTGKLYIRRTEVESTYDDFSFNIEVRDMGGSGDMLERILHNPPSILQSPAPIAPAIIVPSSPIELVYGFSNPPQEIEITNEPTKVEVDGTWLGIEYKKTDNGVEIFGEIPAKGTGTGQATPGVESGDFTVRARNGGVAAGNPDISDQVPWTLIEIVKPQFVSQSFSVQTRSNEGVTDTIKITADPQPTIVLVGSLPPGISLEQNYSGTTMTLSFSGTATTTGTYNFTIRATNRAGLTISPQFSIVVTEPLVAPSTKRNIPSGGQWHASSNMWLRNPGWASDMRTYFNLGNPEGTISVSGAGLTISSQGVLDFSGVTTGRNQLITFTVTNTINSVVHTATLTTRLTVF